MNTTIIRILTTISILFSMINASGQTCPNKALQRQMQTEETSFLANMKPGLQHIQMLPDMIYFSTRRQNLPGDFSALDILFHIMSFRQRHIYLSLSLASLPHSRSPSELSPAS